MTIVAYRDGVLAADKRCSDAGLARIVTKIRRLRDGRIAGAAGNSSMCVRLLQWIDEGGDISKFPDSKRECSALVVNLDGSLLLWDEGDHPIRIEEQFTAIGSGRDWAIGAMEEGASATRAVEVACKYNISCGNGMDVLHLKGADASTVTS